MKQQEQEDIMSIVLKYEDNDRFLHCDHCMAQYMKDREANGGESKQSPREAMAYEGATQRFVYPDGTVANIFTLWCKNCGRHVWDSRHLTHLF